MAKKILIMLLASVITFSFVLFGCGGGEAVKETTGQASETEESQTAEQATETEKAEAGEGVTTELKEGVVTFMTSDGIKISGNIFGTGGKWVILSHMLQTDQTAWFDFAELLKQNGFIVLTYDFRGIGHSGGSMYKKGVQNMYLDLEAAMSFIKQFNPEKIYLVGAVVGATVSLKVAAKETVNGVVSISGLEEFQDLSVKDEIGTVTAPKLFLASSKDKKAAENAQILFDGSVDPKEIQILEGSSNGTNMLSEYGDSLKQMILDFLNEN